MQVDNQIFYHIHKKGYYDDKWDAGKMVIFDKTCYNSFFDYYNQITFARNDDSISIEDKIKEYGMLIRELIYEEVRLAHFSNCPSRRHCIWLCEENELQLWINTLGDGCDLYKVSVTGNIHECYAGALEDEYINYGLLYQKALGYWRGECIGNPREKEYLLEGIVKIIAKL